ncbi:LOW QUALITY PROTEIN: cadherin-16 [Chlamydotis macqueenii]
MSPKVAFNSNIRCTVDIIKDKLLCHQNQFAVFKPGVPFVPGCTTDSDDPSAPNAELQYKILQTLSQPSEHMFQMYSRTWAISLSAEDSSVLGTSQLSNYHIIVQVKDLGIQSLGYCTLATVEVAIVENIQVAPCAIFHPELLNMSYPQIISKHEIQVLAGNSDRLLYSDPLTLLITVMAENNNLPVFTQEFYQVALKENTAKRENDSYACKIAYEILSQEAQISNGFSFHIGKEIGMTSKDTGVITLQDYDLNTSVVKHYWPCCSSSRPLSGFEYSGFSLVHRKE